MKAAAQHVPTTEMDTRKLSIRDPFEQADSTSWELCFGPERVARVPNETTAAELVRRWNSHPDLLAALEALELRCTQARIASNIGQPRLKDADFLRRECERIATDARAAITNATNTN